MGGREKERKGRKRLAPEGAKVGPGWRGRPPPDRDQASEAISVGASMVRHPSGDLGLLGEF